MTSLSYPKGHDLLWIASGQGGQLAAFITAGEGPIPQVLLADRTDIYSVEDEVFYLPTVTSHKLLVSVPRPDDFISLAQRGLFVYDWRDVHRSSSRSTGNYEMVAVPTRPILIEDLQGPLRRLSELVVLDGVSFELSQALDVKSLIECCADS